MGVVLPCKAGTDGFVMVHLGTMACVSSRPPTVLVSGVLDFRMVVQNGNWRNVLTNGVTSYQMDHAAKYKHSIVYSVTLIITDSMPVIHVYDVTP